MVSNSYLDGFIPAGANHNECILDTGVSNISFDCHGCVASLTPEVQGTDIKLHYAMNDILEAFN